MPELQTTCGRIVDLRRHTNVHLYGRRPLGPTDRYELWVRQRGGRERKFTIHTRTMPARRGHDVSVVAVAGVSALRVLAMINWTTADAVNYVRADPPSLLLGSDVAVVVSVLVAMVVVFGDAGLALSVPAATVWLVVAASVRAIGRAVGALRVDRAMAKAAKNGGDDRSPR